MNARTPLKKHLRVSMFVVTLALAVQTAQPANILFVSDNPDANDNQFLPPLVGFPDDFYVIMLQNAGHNVRRFNPPASQNTQLTPAQITAINTNDLIIVSRSINSGPWQVPQSANWNTKVTKPLIMCSPYLVRPDGGRLGWFTGGTLPDTVPPTYLRGPDVTDPETDFLFADVAMSGDRMVDSFDEPLERNTSTINNPVVAGGKELALIGVGSPVGSRAIAEFPAGILVRTNADVLAGYRMFFAAGSREADGVPIPLGAGRDNLTPAGEKIFMRAVELALRNGQAPFDPNAPVGFQTEPVSITVVEGTPVTFSVTVTGAPPRWVEWQRDQGDGTYTNVPGAATFFRTSDVRFPRARLEDNGASFMVVATNALGVVTSQVATLTVLADTNPPTIVAVRTKWTMTNVFLTYSEPVDPVSATETFNYRFENDAAFVDSATLDGTGTNLTLNTTPLAAGTAYTLIVNGILDLAAQPNLIEPDTMVSFTAFADSHGFLVSELFTGLPTGNAVSLLTTHTNYPNNPNITGYVNVSSNAPTSPNRDQYGGRLVGWLIPPVDGSYIFYIRGDDGTELRLGSSADPLTLTPVASQAGVSANYLPSNPLSTPVSLIGGQAYAVEALWKEGTGGDWMQFAWTPPWSTNIEAIAGSYFRTYAPGEGVSVSITAHPQGSTVEENRSATLSVGATSTPGGLLQSYQWQKGDGAGGFTNALGGFHGQTYTTPLLQYPDDNGSQWRVIVYVLGGASATSEVATVTVEDDVTPPVALSAGSMDGLQIGVCFSEAVFGGANTTFNYGVFDKDGNGMTLLSATLRSDSRSVVLRLGPPALPPGRFSVFVQRVQDLSGNPVVETTLVSDVAGLSGADLGPVLQRGEHWTCDPSIFEVIGGGTDIFGNNDQGHFASRTITGDFDAQVRVRDLTLTASTGGPLIAKAGLMVRSMIISNSPTIWLLGNAPPPGRDLIESGYRANSNGTTIAWAPNETNIHMPNMWMRMARAGTNITHSASSNGVDWITLGTTNTTLPANVLLGVAVTAHNNVAGLASTGLFSNFSLSQPVADLSLTKAASGAVYVGSNITYIISVANAGPDGANLVRVTDPIPGGTAHVSSTPSQGACALAAGVLTCNLGSIASGGSATITLVTSTSTAGTKTNTATVLSAAVDPNPGNNTASVEVPVHAHPRISNLNYNAGAGSFSMSVQTQSGFSYRVQYKDKLDDPEWLTLTVLTGDGTVQTITDPPGPTVPPGTGPRTRFYRIIVE